MLVTMPFLDGDSTFPRDDGSWPPAPWMCGKETEDGTSFAGNVTDLYPLQR